MPNLDISVTPGFLDIIEKIDATIAVSTYQAGKLLLLNSNNKKLHQEGVSFKKPMGIALNGNRSLAVATFDSLQVFHNVNDFLNQTGLGEKGYDAAYTPNTLFSTGVIDLHDIAFAKNNIWGVNTAFSCLVTFDYNYSFTPRWKPYFIKDVDPFDRCHLNGMCLDESGPKYVTALGKTNEKKGWRKDIISGGVLMDVPSNKIVAENLAMPHSPRFIDGELFFLQSAMGQLCKLNRETQKVEVVAETGCFIRGLAHFDDYIFIACSKARESSETFSKLPIMKTSINSGIMILNKKTFDVVGEMKYDAAIDEIFDIQVMPNIKKPAVLDFNDEGGMKAIIGRGVNYWIENKKGTAQATEE